MVAVLAFAATVGLTGWLAYSVWRDLDASRGSAGGVTPGYPSTPPLLTQSPQYEQLAVNTPLEWSAESAAEEVVRQAGPFVVKITKKKDDELVAPLVTVTGGPQSVTMEGSEVTPGFAHKITFIENRSVSGPAVMLQSFSGGAHCCNSIQLAGFVAGKLKVLDLGSWDGDYIDPPKDISGDGVVDFVMYDNSFLYAFASYADSSAPPKILNVINGEVRDVSGNPAFRPLFAKEMQAAGQLCRAGSDRSPNGACASYVAAAARLGKLNQAWPQMLAAYDATSDWDLPTGCRVREGAGGCPDGAKIIYKSYPEALLAFLKGEGYIAQGWLPPEAFQPTQEDADSAPIT